MPEFSNPFKKGDRVEFTDNDEVLRYGVIAVSSGNKVQVVEDGGKSWSGHFRAFRQSDHPLAEVPLLDNPFKKGDRAEWEAKDKTKHYGIVLKCRDANVEILEDDGKTIWKGNFRRFRKSVQPFPENSLINNPYKKGDRVEWQDKEMKTLYGTVKSISKEVMVIILEDGGKVQWRLHFKNIKITEVPLPKDEPNHMDKWGVVSYREIKHGHGDSRTFSAYITLNGKKVLHVSNDGQGGCNMYSPVKNGSRDIERQFADEAKAWARMFGHDALEPDDLWVEWYQHDRPLGIKAEDYFKEFKAIFAKDKKEGE